MQTICMSLTLLLYFSVNKPADNHELCVLAVLAEEHPDVHGEDGTATVEDRGE